MSSLIAAVVRRPARPIYWLYKRKVTIREELEVEYKRRLSVNTKEIVRRVVVIDQLLRVYLPIYGRAHYDSV